MFKNAFFCIVIFYDKRCISLYITRDINFYGLPFSLWKIAKIQFSTDYGKHPSADLESQISAKNCEVLLEKYAFGKFLNQNRLRNKAPFCFQMENHY